MGIEVSTIDDEIPVEEELISLDIAANQIPEADRLEARGDQSRHKDKLKQIIIKKT